MNWPYLQPMPLAGYDGWNMSWMGAAQYTVPTFAGYTPAIPQWAPFSPFSSYSFGESFMTSLNYFGGGGVCGVNASCGNWGRTGPVGYTGLFGVTPGMSDPARYSYQHMQGGNPYGNVFDLFEGSRRADNYNMWVNRQPGVYGGTQPPSPQPQKPQQQLMNFLERANVYYDYRGTPKKFDEAVANRMNAGHPNERPVGKSDVSTMIEKTEEQMVDGRSMVGRDEFLRALAKNSQQVLTTSDIDVRRDLLANHLALKVKYHLPELSPTYMTNEVAGAMILNLLGRSDKANQTVMGTLRQFLEARGIQVDQQEEDLAAKAVLLFQDYFGDNWRDVLNLFYQRTVNDASEITEVPMYNGQPNQIMYELTEKKQYTPEAAAVIANLLAKQPYPRIVEILNKIENMDKVRREESKDRPHEQEWNAYVTAILLARGYHDADLKSNSAHTIMEVAKGWVDKKTNRYQVDVPEFRAKGQMTLYLHTLNDRLDEIQRKRDELRNSGDSDWERKWTEKEFPKMLKRFRKEDKKRL